MSSFSLCWTNTGGVIHQPRLDENGLVTARRSREAAVNNSVACIFSMDGPVLASAVSDSWPIASPWQPSSQEVQTVQYMQEYALYTPIGSYHSVFPVLLFSVLQALMLRSASSIERTGFSRWLSNHSELADFLQSTEFLRGRCLLELADVDPLPSLVSH